MRPYGVRVIEHPDVADIKEMGAKSSCGRFPGKSGDFHPYAHGNCKARVRRAWKSKARQAAKRDLRVSLRSF